MKTQLEKKMKYYHDDFINNNQNEESISEIVRLSIENISIDSKKNRMSYLEFIYQQSRYIKKYLWILQGLLLLGLWITLQMLDSSFYMKRIMGASAPIFAIIILPELWKNEKFSSIEIEATTFYSLRQIYSARMILFSIVDILLLSLFITFTSITGELTIGEIIFHFLIPFNITCCICFKTLYSKKYRSEYVALFLSLIWTLFWVLIVMDRKLYEIISTPIAIGLFVVSLVYLVYYFKQLQNKCENTWEGNYLWN